MAPLGSWSTPLPQIFRTARDFLIIKPLQSGETSTPKGIPKIL